MTLPTDAKARKDVPLCRGLLDYFPDACAAVAEVSRIGNEQHNPGEPMHWARGKSTDHADCIVRHMVDRGKLDTDGQRHSAKIAWRALALLQTELEESVVAPIKVEWADPRRLIHSAETASTIMREDHQQERIVPLDWAEPYTEPDNEFEPCSDCHSHVCIVAGTCTHSWQRHRG